MITLQNKRLTVTIAEPNKECVTSRFDRAGFITQVRLDDTYDFLGQEDMLDGSLSSGGMGLCSEIQCDPLSATAAIGEQFPKFGVGILTQNSDKPYYFMDPYETDSYDISYTKGDAEITFTTAAKEIGGYAVSQTKHIKLEENRLIMTYSLKNEGSKEIEFEEYCHNFISLNNKKVNKDYYLTIPCVTPPKGEIKTLPISTTLYSDGIGLSKSEESMTFALYAFSEEETAKLDTYSWKMEDLKEGIAIEEIDDFQVPHVTVWTVGDVLSPEMFFKAKLAPGEETTWTRTWAFYK